MNKILIIILFLILNSCSTFEKEQVKCPKIISPKKAAEIISNSENNRPVYIGFRGVETFCFKDGNNIEMEILVNIRAIRNDTTIEDYVPVNIMMVSLDLNEKEFDRDGFNYSHFLLKGSRMVDRVTTFVLTVPNGGHVLLGIK